MSKKAFQFETALEDLQKILKQMEQGDLSLEQSLKQFEQGIKLTRQCQQALQEAEQKVEILMEQAGEDILADYEQQDDEQ